MGVSWMSDVYLLVFYESNWQGEIPDENIPEPPCVFIHLHAISNMIHSSSNAKMREFCKCRA